VPDRLSGVDAISPAIERTKRQLFAPVRFRHWLRLATLCLLTGEMTGGGGGGWTGLNLTIPNTNRGGKGLLNPATWPNPVDPRLMEYLPWIAAGVFVIFALALVFVYVASVFRFVVFETVLYDRCELMNGWRRWQRQGSSYFLWVIGFGLACLLAVIVLIGGPLYFAWLAGVFSQPGEHIVLLALGGVLIFLLAATMILVSAVGSVFTKDFVVPVMALENVGVLAGWRRVLPMLAADKGAYVVYVLMKIVLAVGSALLFGIVNFVVLLGLLVPVGILGVVIVLVASAAGLSWNPVTISLAVVAGGLVLTVLIYVVSFVSAPAMVFFQAFSLHFFGSRYPLLGDQLALTTPAPKPSPPMAPAAPVPAS
jgi:hypothetical protein